MRRRSGDRLRVEVERNLELDMLDIRGSIAGPFRFHVLGLKRAAPARKRSTERVAIAKLNRQLIEKSGLMHAADPTNPTTHAQSEKISAYFTASAATIAPAEMAITVQNRKMPRDPVGGFADARRIAASAVG